jgi:Phospholipase_D-nuclease N-terminal
VEAWEWAVVIIPLIIVQVTLMVIALVDLARRDAVRGGSKLVWGLVIVLINTIGPIVYLLWGREADLDRTGD